MIFKCFVDYKNDQKVKRACIMLPKMNMYNVLMKLNTCLYLSRMISCWLNTKKSGKKSVVVLKQNLIANQYTMKIS